HHPHHLLVQSPPPLRLYCLLVYERHIFCCWGVAYLRVCLFRHLFLRARCCVHLELGVASDGGRASTPVALARLRLEAAHYRTHSPRRRHPRFVDAACHHRHARTEILSLDYPHLRRGLSRVGRGILPLALGLFRVSFAQSVLQKRGGRLELEHLQRLHVEYAPVIFAGCLCLYPWLPLERDAEDNACVHASHRRVCRRLRLGLG